MGLTALTAALFFLSMFALPLFAAIHTTSACLTIVLMFFYSNTKGIGVGMISCTLMSAIEYLVGFVKYLITKKDKSEWNVSVITLVVFLLFCVYCFAPAR